MLQILYILPVTAASAVALNEHRTFLLFLYGFKTKCVNMAVIYILYAQALLKKQISFKVLQYLLRN